MNKLVISLIIFLLTVPFYADSQCPSGDVSFENQSPIDQFLIDYP